VVGSLKSKGVARITGTPAQIGTWPVPWDMVELGEKEKKPRKEVGGGGGAWGGVAEGFTAVKNRQGVVKILGGTLRGKPRSGGGVELWVEHQSAEGGRRKLWERARKGLGIPAGRKVPINHHPLSGLV